MPCGYFLAHGRLQQLDVLDITLSFASWHTMLAEMEPIISGVDDYEWSQQCAIQICKAERPAYCMYPGEHVAV